MSLITKKYTKQLIAAVLLVITIITACTTPTPVIQTVEVTKLVPQVLVATLIIKETVMVTSIAEGLAVAAATATPMAPLPEAPQATPIPTITATLAPILSFPNAKINSFGYRSNADFFITVDMGGPITSEYKAIVGNNEYFCEKVVNYPERLYCYGPFRQYGQILTLRIFTDDARRTTVYETEFMAPLKSTPTATPTQTQTPTSTP